MAWHVSERAANALLLRLPQHLAESRDFWTGVPAQRAQALANTAEPISPRRHPGVQGRFAAVPRAYRNRTWNGQFDCVTGDLSRLSAPFLLVVETLVANS